MRHQKIRLNFLYHVRKNEISGSLVINLHNIGSFPITLNFLTVMTAPNFFGWTAISRWNGWCSLIFNLITLTISEILKGTWFSQDSTLIKEGFRDWFLRYVLRTEKFSELVIISLLVMM